MKTSLLFFMLAVALLQGCAPYRSTKGPMNSVHDTLECRTQPTTLIVFLPGAYDTPQDFIDQGFVSAVRKQKIHADIQLVDAHTGYYTGQQILQRLENEVIKPARVKGYTRIWFVGISLGGYGTLLYAMNHPQVIDGFFIMAPYMGARDIPAQIQKQGGLKNWSSDVQGNADVDLWRWLQGYSAAKTGLPEAYLGYGDSDRFAQPNGVLAQALPPGNSFVTRGGHDWPVWQKLFDSFLNAAPWPRLEPGDFGCQAK
jgi:pimeloyl-ACP methyl ester carboxylesterase